MGKLYSDIQKREKSKENNPFESRTVMTITDKPSDIETFDAGSEYSFKCISYTRDEECARQLKNEGYCLIFSPKQAGVFILAKEESDLEERGICK